MRRPIDPNIDAIKKVAPAVQIPPEHSVPNSLIEKELEDRRLGPASHDPNYKLVEPRQDQGVVKIMEPYFEKKEDFSEGNVIDLYPNKPKKNRLVFKYMKPVDRKIEPQIEPDTWVYYDVDLDAVRAELAQNVFMSGRMNATEFKEHSEFLHLLEEHLKRKDRRPEHGDYEKPFGPEKEVKVPIFDNQSGRNDFEDDRFEIEQEGDVLILDPAKLGKRLPQIDFKKMTGREDLQKIDEEKEELILEPDIDVIKKRQPVFVDMAKDRGREEQKVCLDDDEYYMPGEVDTEIAPFNPRKPRPIAYDFGKAGERFPDKPDMHETED